MINYLNAEPIELSLRQRWASYLTILVALGGLGSGLLLRNQSLREPDRRYRSTLPSKLAAGRKPGSNKGGFCFPGAGPCFAPVQNHPASFTPDRWPGRLPRRHPRFAEYDASHFLFSLSATGNLSNYFARWHARNRDALCLRFKRDQPVLAKRSRCRGGAGRYRCKER